MAAKKKNTYIINEIDYTLTPYIGAAQGIILQGLFGSSLPGINLGDIGETLRAILVNNSNIESMATFLSAVVCKKDGKWNRADTEELKTYMIENENDIDYAIIMEVINDFFTLSDKYLDTLGKLLINIITGTTKGMSAAL